MNYSGDTSGFGPENNASWADTVKAAELDYLTTIQQELQMLDAADMIGTDRSPHAWNVALRQASRAQSDSPTFMMRAQELGIYGAVFRYELMDTTACSEDEAMATWHAELLNEPKRVRANIYDHPLVLQFLDSEPVEQHILEVEEVPTIIARHLLGLAGLQDPVLSVDIAAYEELDPDEIDRVYRDLETLDKALFVQSDLTPQQADAAIGASYERGFEIHKRRGTVLNQYRHHVLDNGFGTPRRAVSENDWNILLRQDPFGVLDAAFEYAQKQVANREASQ